MQSDLGMGFQVPGSNSDTQLLIKPPKCNNNFTRHKKLMSVLTAIFIPSWALYNSLVAICKQLMQNNYSTFLTFAAKQLSKDQFSKSIHNRPEFQDCSTSIPRIAIIGLCLKLDMALYIFQDSLCVIE